MRAAKGAILDVVEGSNAATAAPADNPTTATASGCSRSTRCTLDCSDACVCGVNRAERSATSRFLWRRRTRARTPLASLAWRAASEILDTASPALARIFRLGELQFLAQKSGKVGEQIA
jgi:hypothetical protein